MLLDSPIDSLPNTSTITIRRLKSLGINTYWNLLNYFPTRYENFSLISPIKSLQPGEQVTVIGTVADSQYQVARTGLHIQKFHIQDETGTITVQWYNQPYLLTLLKKGSRVAVAGSVKAIGRQLQLEPYQYELLPTADISSLKHTGRIVPVYSEKKGLSSKTLREKIWSVLSSTNSRESITEVLPQAIISYNQLYPENLAYTDVHFPQNLVVMNKSRQRLAFDELFIIQLSHALIRQEWTRENVGHPFITEKHLKLLTTFINHLPFTLTNAQQRVWKEIFADLIKPQPMNRLLQGEVGSGKTVVAVLAAYLSFLNGYQTLIMAPTEILAQQHYKTFTDLFNLKFEITNLNSNLKFKIKNCKKPKICLLTGSFKPPKQEIDSSDIIIGTHALLQKRSSFNRVGLVIIDEQHRFGVVQRALLKSKGINPHLLTMTATPIPRTVMLTLYGELDLSVIDEMPKGRLPVKTYYIQAAKRKSCYEWIKKQIAEFHVQAFIICPLIEESTIESMKSVRAAKKEFEHLCRDVFDQLCIGLVHGKLKATEKEQMMTEFKQGTYDILVATPVVEVGIDIPNATVMIIEGAERFGLAQLHQLRGRIGRGNHQSYCFLFTEKDSPDILNRLTFFSKINDGNALAEKDLKLRGPGNMYGEEQHGYMNFAIASLSDYPMIERTKKAVKYFMEHYHRNQFEELNKRVEHLRLGEISKD